jgi:hypothetical protein
MEGSACSDFPLRDIVEFYKRHGYQGFCVTDHFTGNSRLPEDTPWAERVNFHYDIYDKTQEAAAKLHLSVFFGMEVSILRDPLRMKSETGTHFLILGLEREWLLANADMFSANPVKDFAKIRAAGGFIIHAHPFNEASWIDYIRLLPRSVDAVEVINGGQSEQSNYLARQYAENYGLPATAGTDLHHKDRSACCGISTSVSCGSVRGLVEEIRQGRAEVFAMTI